MLDRKKSGSKLGGRMEGDEDVNKKQGANSDIGDDNSGKEEEDFYA